MQIDRLFHILYTLLHKKSVSARELAEYLGVSRRTICRDIDTLCLAGLPIYADRGKGGGIRLMANFVLNTSIVSEHEQNEILAALQGLSTITTGNTKQILTKLSGVFNKTAVNWIKADFSGWEHENDFWGSFKTAITERRVLEFDYYNSSGEKTFRRVEPVQLWFKSKAWYLKGFCKHRQAIRLYKLPRIKNLAVTDEHFSLPDIPAVPEDAATDTEQQNTVALKLRIEPEMAYRVFDVFYESMVEKQADGSFLVTVEWPEDTWLYGFVLSFGQYIEVLEPQHIRSKIKDEAQKIFQKYS